MKARLRLLPFDEPLAVYELEKDIKINALLHELGADDEFFEKGKCILEFHEIENNKWGLVTLKADAPGFIDFCVVPGNKSTAFLIASVALAVAVTFISAGGLGPAGLGLLGATFGAGGIGASLAAAGVGLAGAYALGQLTALPPSAQGDSQKPLSQAGITGNSARPDELLPVIFGKIGYSAPLIAPFYTTFDSEVITVNAIIGVEGPCLIENIKINGVAVEDCEGLLYESRDGRIGALPLTLAQRTIIQPPGEQTLLSNFNASQETAKNAELTHQDDPDSDLPKWAPFITRGLADEIWIRLLFTSGIARIDADENATVPIRIEIRKVGDVTWRKLPTLHFNDVRKGRGQLRQEVKLLFKKQTSGPHVSRSDGDFPMYYASNDTGRGETFNYTSDAYFAGPSQANPLTNSIIPTMTAATTGTVTMSASSTNGTDAAWKASDSGLNFWRVANNSLPAWIQIQFSTPQIARSYYFTADADSTVTPGTMPTKFYWSGSNDGVNFTRLDPSDVDISANPMPRVFGQIEDYGSYTYYRLNILANNGAANQQVNILDFRMFLTDSPGISLNDNDYTPQIGATAKHDDTNTLASSVYVSANKNGCNIFLDPAQWDTDAEYQVRVMRGQAFDFSSFTPQTYDYQSTSGASDFFTYRTVSGKFTIRVGQKNYRSDVSVEAFSTVSNDIPVDTTGIACIAIQMDSTNVKSIYAEWTCYGNEHDGSVWNEIQVPTRRPAAHYRNVLLGYANSDPASGEVIQPDVFEDWFANCVSADHQCNMVVNGQVIRDVLQIIATCGMAAPRNSNELGVIQDIDTSAEPPRNPLTAANSRNTGTQYVLPLLPHGVRLEFFDETDNYSINSTVTIYREGYNVLNATLFETRRYPGFTAVAKVTTRGTFDIRQLMYRAKRYFREVGLEGLNFEPGQLSALNDDVLETTHAAGWIKSWQTSGANVVSITLTHVMPWGRAQQDVTQVDDVLALTDVLDQDVPMGIFYRDANGDEHLHQVSDVSDSNVATFVTPFAFIGSGLEADLMVGAGRWGNVRRRVKVMAKIPKSMDKWTLQLADEAPQLFLP